MARSLRTLRRETQHHGSNVFYEALLNVWILNNSWCVMFVMFVLGLLMARYRNGRTMYGLPGQESNVPTVNQRSLCEEQTTSRLESLLVDRAFAY